MTPGFLVVDKPAGITSHDVVAAVRAVTGIKKVGHTGTLDPFATGVLPLALGPATRLIQFLDESIKVYDATIVLGQRTDTGDPTGEIVETLPVPDFTDEQLDAVLRGFVGERDQVPPAYSAVKVDGKALYRYAREGKDVKVAARRITIHDMELVGRTETGFRVQISCGRGTYARVLAEELGVELGTVGHLGALSRLRSGPFFLEDAVSMQTLSDWVAPGAGHPWQAVLMSRGRNEERVKWAPRADVQAAVTERLISGVRALSHLPLVDVPPPIAKAIRSGAAAPAPPAGVEAGGRYLVVNGPSVVGIVEATTRGPKVLKSIPA